MSITATTNRPLAFKLAVGALILAALGGGLWAAMLASGKLRAAPTSNQPSPVAINPRVELVSEQPDSLRLPDDFLTAQRVKVAAVEGSPAPEPLRLPGSLALDTDKLAQVHCLFAGQVVRFGTADADGQRRPLRRYDYVRKDQVLAVVWSKDVGEKKSELVAALSQLALDQALVRRYEQVDQGVIALRNVQEARQKVEADLVSVARAERTLRSWRLTEAEIAAVRREADKIREKKPATDRDVEKTWAETAIRAPFDGMIVEKNVTVGDIIDPSAVLFKIADLRRLQILANVYEEDLPYLRQLPAERRRWKVALKSDTVAAPIDGSFELMGKFIDPTQHAGLVMGWMDNPDGRLQVGQYLTATVELPPDPALVAVPAGAVIEEDSDETVFVETNAERHEFRRQKVAVVRRGRDRIVIRAEPTAAEKRSGAAPLRPGDRVIVAGALELATELANLKSSSSGR